ncbi:hypothetical protein A9Z06_12810 [Rhizobium sp. YK2]|nr:hypothetical protein A9Z06_12810 [Rhizobium sp. YK2]
MLGQVMMSGFAMGCIYALIALGYAYVWNTMAIVNFAAGEFLTFAAYVFVASFTMSMGFPFWLAAILTCAFMAVLGALFSMLVFARLQKQKSLVAIIATVGFGIFLRELARIIYGPQPILYESPFGDGVLEFAGIYIPVQQLVVICTVLVIMVVQYLVLRYSMMGKVMRATALDRETAALMGIPVGRVLAGAFAFSSVLAAIAGILLAPLFYVTTEMGTLVGLKGFVAMIIGGFGSVPGAIVGGVLLGVVENVGAFEISSSYKDAIAFGVLLIFLLLRPQGLLPERDADRA